MKKRLLFSCLFLALCLNANPADARKRSNGNREKEKAQKEASEVVDWKCPQSDAKPDFLSKVKSGEILMVCGFEDKRLAPPAGKQAISEFNVYSIKRKGKDKNKPMRVFGASALDSYWMRKGDDGDLFLEELWISQNKFVPTIQSRIGCKNGTCKILETKCFAQFPKNPFPGITEQVRKVVGKNDQRSDPEGLLEKTFEQAMGGEKEAQDFFLEQIMPKGLEGAAAEVWDVMNVRLIKAKHLGCLPTNT